MNRPTRLLAAGGIIRRAAEAFPGGAHDRACLNAGWGEPTDLAGIGEMMARWLEGTVRARPGFGHTGDDRPDDETTHLIPVLAAACRAGYVTDNSQPGRPESPGWDDALWRQRADVTGYVADRATVDRLARLARAAGLIVMFGRPGRRTDYRQQIDVSQRERHRTCSSGAVQSRGAIADFYGLCSEPAVCALQDAWQVMLVDPEWGRDDVLWPVLAEFAAGGTP
jgi:hypothetical protein